MKPVEDQNQDENESINHLRSELAEKEQLISESRRLLSEAELLIAKQNAWRSLAEIQLAHMRRQIISLTLELKMDKA